MNTPSARAPAASVRSVKKSRTGALRAEVVRFEKTGTYNPSVAEPTRIYALPEKHSIDAITAFLKTSMPNGADEINRMKETWKSVSETGHGIQEPGPTEQHFLKHRVCEAIAGRIYASIKIIKGTHTSFSLTPDYQRALARIIDEGLTLTQLVGKPTVGKFYIVLHNKR